MDRDTVVKLAREAGANIFCATGIRFADNDELTRFATLVRNAALEEAAKVADDYGYEHSFFSAGAIRALKE